MLPEYGDRVGLLSGTTNNANKITKRITKRGSKKVFIISCIILFIIVGGIISGFVYVITFPRLSIYPKSIYTNDSVFCSPSNVCDNGASSNFTVLLNKVPISVICMNSSSPSICDGTWKINDIYNKDTFANLIGSYYLRNSAWFNEKCDLDPTSSSTYTVLYAFKNSNNSIKLICGDNFVYPGT